MKIVQNLVPESKWSLKCPYPMTPTRIVVHNTYNDASAKNEIAYMVSNSTTTSYHYAVDDVEVVQGLLETRNGWHASDGTYGKGNREGIGIEICYSKSGGDRFVKAEQNAVELIADILKRYGWGIEKVTKHQDYTNKYCPHRTLDMGWSRFLKMIEAKLETKVEPKVEVKTYKVVTPINKYNSSGDAKNKANSKGQYKVGTYYIYNKYPDGYNGMLNITTDKTGNTAGSWINPSENVASGVGTYKVIKPINKYNKASDAKAKVNSKGTYSAGTYYIYTKYPNGYNGMYNITTDKTGKTAGSWINPSENK